MNQKHPAVLLFHWSLTLQYMYISIRGSSYKNSWLHLVWKHIWKVSWQSGWKSFNKLCDLLLSLHTLLSFCRSHFFVSFSHLIHQQEMLASGCKCGAWGGCHCVWPLTCVCPAVGSSVMWRGSTWWTASHSAAVTLGPLGLASSTTWLITLPIMTTTTALRSSTSGPGDAVRLSSPITAVWWAALEC